MAKDKKANPLLDDEETTETTPKKAVKAKKPAKAVVEDEVDNDDELDNDEVENDEDEQDEKPAKKPAKVAAVAPRTDVANEMLTDIQMTKKALEKEDKVRIFIPLGIGEKKGSPSAVETVTINGYRQVFPKGEYISVPLSIADKIEEHYNMTPENTEAGSQFRLDRARTKDGMSTDDALSA